MIIFSIVKRSQQGNRFLFQDSTGDGIVVVVAIFAVAVAAIVVVGIMVVLRGRSVMVVVVQRQYGSTAAKLVVATTKHNATHTHFHQCSGAHDARFARDVETALR